MNVINSYRFKDSLSRGYFITTWKTDNAGTSNSTSITIPVSGGPYNFEISWKNNNVWETISGNNPNVSHDYGAPGTYTVAIRGVFPYIRFNNTGDKLKILSIEQWGNIQWTSFTRSFSGCENLVINATDSPNLQNVTNLHSMFLYANNVNFDASSWDVSNVQYFNNMFYDTNFNGNVSNWNMTNAIEISGIFWDSPFNQDVSGWDVSNVNGFAAFSNSLSTINYDKLLISWSQLPLQTGQNLQMGSTKYSAGAAATARQKIIDDFNWTITDGGQV